MGFEGGSSETGGWRHEQGQHSVNLEMELGLVLKAVGAIEGVRCWDHAVLHVRVFFCMLLSGQEE